MLGNETKYSNKPHSKECGFISNMIKMANYIQRLNDLRRVPIGRLVVFNHCKTPDIRGNDFYDAGIIDPTKVARVALEKAASISGLLLTTESIIANENEKEPVQQEQNFMM